MTKIKILRDRDCVYEEGQIIDVNALIQDYIDVCSDRGTSEWIVCIPISSALAFIADAWGIEYEFV